MIRRRGKGPKSPHKQGLKNARTRRRMKEQIADAKGGEATPNRRGRRRRRADIGRPRGRLYPQRGLAAKQAYGLAPVPEIIETASGVDILDDDDGTE